MGSIRGSSRSYSSSSSSSQLSVSGKQINDQKPAQNTVKYVYQTHIAGYWRNVIVLWSKNLMVYSLYISVESVEGDRVSTSKIELKPWHFWSRKGCKAFMVDGNLLQVYWDLRSAKFSGPEPVKEFYISLVSDQENVLLMGDLEKKAYKTTKAQSPSVDALMLYKEEHVFGKKSFPTRANFDRTQEHDIVVESSSLGDKDLEMWITIDGVVLIHIKNLQWKFRGNQTVQVNKQPVQVFWDVHAWLFCPPGSGHASFIFKPGGGDSDSNAAAAIDDNSDQCEGRHSALFFLYAWKLE